MHRKADGIKAAAFCMCFLLTDAELCDSCAVSFDVLLLEVSKKVSSAATHLEHTSAGMMVVFVNFQMFCQVVDTASQDSNLNFRRASIGSVIAILFDNGCLFFFTQHDSFTPLKIELFSADIEQGRRKSQLGHNP